MSCIKRLQKELKQLHENPLPGIHAEPSASSLREWHYVIVGDKDSVFTGGVYHGTISFPEDYPFSPPTSIRMRTPNGRFIPNEKICLSITSYHPESWSPLWNISTLLLGFQSFFYCHEKGAIGVLQGTRERDIRRMAAQSMEFNKKDKEFCSLFPYLLVPPKEEEETAASPTKRKATELLKPEMQHKKSKRNDDDDDRNNNKKSSTVDQLDLSSENDVEIVYITEEIDLTAD
ncbi:Ubiquitin-conjugating enzyme E2 J2 [Picochlorum sp. SENEW3]|nr:Ubiquitin-conjugating enzyme E2 J2 [Picochlorum sp. SENEW3]